MKKALALMIAAGAISGCVAPIGNSIGSSLNGATDPTYVVSQSQGTVSRHCLKARRGGFGELPPGCLVDTAFASQVAYPHDLTTPHTPGASSPRSTAVAASPYLQGGASVEADGGT